MLLCLLENLVLTPPTKTQSSIIVIEKIQSVFMKCVQMVDFRYQIPEQAAVMLLHR